MIWFGISLFLFMSVTVSWEREFNFGGKGEVYFFPWPNFIELVIDCCLMPTQQFVSYIMAKTS